MKFNLNMEELTQKIEEAPAEQKSQAIVESIQKALDMQKEQIIEEYEAAFAEVQSNKEHAAAIGLRTLNQEEKDFYQAVVTGGFYKDNERDLTLPERTLNYIFEDLKRERPFLRYVEFAPAGLEEWIFGEVVGEAVWGDIEAAISENAEIKGNLKRVKLDVGKLAAFAMVPNAIIDLGYEWVDLYVRESLVEVMAEGLEKGYIAGEGPAKDQPIGLIRKLTGVVDDVYQERDAVKIKSFSAQELLPQIAPLTNDGKRTLSKLLLVVNPNDEFTLIKPASTFLTSAGEHRDAFPYNIEIVPAVGVPSGKAILYIPNSYQGGVSSVKLSESTDFRFLHDEKTYKIVAYANGRIKRENMAVYLDVSELEPLAFNVQTSDADGKTVEGA